MHIKDHSAAMKFFRTYDNVASKGKWKEFVDEMEFDSMVPEPQAMAEGGPLVGTPTKEVTQFDKRIYETPEGERVSEKSKTFFFNGKWINVPSIHDGVEYDSEERLRNMLKHGKIQATSEHGSRIEAEEAAGLRSNMMKSHTKGFAEGQLVTPSVDGSRPGYAGKGYSWSKDRGAWRVAAKRGPEILQKFVYPKDFDGSKKKAEQSVIKELNEWKTDNPIEKERPWRSADVKDNYKLSNWLKKNKDFDFANSSVEDIVTKSKTSLSKSAATKYLRNLDIQTSAFKFESLPKEVQKEIKFKFANDYKGTWDFDKYKYGFSGSGEGGKNNRTYDNIRRFVNEPKAWRYGGAGLNTPDGWMVAQMDRAWRNGNKNYKPIYRTVNEQKKIVGFIDKSEAGKGKKYISAKEFIKGNDADGVLFTEHDHYANTKKFNDVARKVHGSPSKVITDILSKGGIEMFTEKGGANVKMKHVLNYLIDTKGLDKTIGGMVRHHKGGAYGNPTSDYQILNKIINSRISGIEGRIRTDQILPDDIAKLKKWGASVTHKGVTYGGGPKTAIGGLKEIENLILKGSTDVELYGKEIKGIERWKKADFDKFKNYLEKLGCPKGGKASGGRAGFSTGTTCAIKGREVATRILRNGTASTEQKAILRQMVGAGSAFLKGAGKFAGSILNPKELFKLRNWVGPEAAAFMAAFEGGIIGYDVINNNTPIKEALGDNWFTSWAMPRTLDEYQIEEMRKKGGFSNVSSERFAKSQELASELNRDYEALQVAKQGSYMTGVDNSEEVARKQKAYDAKEAEYFSFVGEGKGMDPYEFQKDRGRMLEERGAGEFIPEENRVETLSGTIGINSEGKPVSVNEYGYAGVADETLLKKKLFGIGLPESWVDQSSGPLPLKKSRVPIYDLPPSEIVKMPEVPFEQGADWALDMKAKLKDVHEIKTPGDYRFAEYEKLTEQDKMDLTNYYRAMGKLKENERLEDTFWEDTGRSILEEAEIAKKWSQLYNYPGMQGSQDPYAEGGLAGLMKKKW